MDPENLTRGINDAFHLEFIGETIYKDIVKLLPGHSLKLRRRGDPVIKKWWKIEEHLVTVPESYEEQVQVFRELFTDACKLRLRSDVPVGIALSGGLDSSSVYSTIQQINNQTINGNWKNAFIACFPDTKMDEKYYADEVINFTNGTPNYIYPEDKHIGSAIYDEIKREDFVYTSPPVVHNIYKEMRKKNIIVSLDGHGADEMLYGYPHMLYDCLIDDHKNSTVELRRTWAEVTGITMEKADQVIAAEFAGREGWNPSPYRNLYDKYLPKGLKTVYRKHRFKSKRSESWLLNYVELAKKQTDLPFLRNNPVLEISYKEVHDKLPTLLRNWDRASMKHGIEIRMPFLDWRLVAYVFSLPQTSKVGEGYTKRIVRDAMKGWMPETVRLRKPKIGINAPMEEWFNDSMSSFILDAVNSPTFLQSHIWNGPLLRDHLTRLTKEKKWTHSDSVFFWPYLNAWILSN
jgi:asparagine synthase (glutamine-hydrolysing)